MYSCSVATLTGPNRSANMAYLKGFSCPQTEVCGPTARMLPTQPCSRLRLQTVHRTACLTSQPSRVRIPSPDYMKKRVPSNEGTLFCERATKRYISRGKNDQKYCSCSVRQIGIGMSYPLETKCFIGSSKW